MRARVLALGITVFSAGCGIVENMQNTLSMEVTGPVLRLDGLINTRALGQFEDVLAENPQLRMVHLGQIDGSTDGVVVAEMGYLIRMQGLSTHMGRDSAVYSGGVDLFLAGVTRQIAQGARVGVHEWETGLGAGRDYPRGSDAHEPTRGYIEDMLGSDAFYWFTLQAAPFDGVYMMRRDELIRYGVVTDADA